MNRLPLTLLPSLRNDENRTVTAREPDGFVDDDVVMALLAGPITARPTPSASDLVLAANDMDFAGWSLPPFLPDRVTRALGAERERVCGRRAAPPVLEEPGLGEPHRGNHRWWLAGLAGALSTLVFSLLLLSLSARNTPPQDSISLSVIPSKAPVPATVESGEELVVPQLTTLPSDK